MGMEDKRERLEPLDDETWEALDRALYERGRETIPSPSAARPLGITFDHWKIEEVSTPPFVRQVWERVDEVGEAARASVSTPQALGRGTIPRDRMSPHPRLSRRGIAMLATGMVVLGGLILRQKPASDPVLKFHTAAAQRSTVRLANGSTIHLGPATSVTMTDGIAHVAGEALFVVSPNTLHPFVVQTRSASVQVLGTTFSVRQYPEESRSRIVVDQGKVSVRTNLQGATSRALAILGAHMSAQVTDSGISVSTNVAPRDFADWARGALVFDRVPLRDVVAELVRAYGVDIRIADTTLAKQVMRIEVSTTDDSITQVLERICRVSDAHYVYDQHRYVLSPGGTTSTSPHDIPRRNQFPQPEHTYGR